MLKKVATDNNLTAAGNGVSALRRKMAKVARDNELQLVASKLKSLHLFVVGPKLTEEVAKKLANDVANLDEFQGLQLSFSTFLTFTYTFD